MATHKYTLTQIQSTRATLYLKKMQPSPGSPTNTTRNLRFFSDFLSHSPAEGSQSPINSPERATHSTHSQHHHIHTFLLLRERMSEASPSSDLHRRHYQTKTSQFFLNSSSPTSTNTQHIHIHSHRERNITPRLHHPTQLISASNDDQVQKHLPHNQLSNKSSHTSQTGSSEYISLCSPILRTQLRSSPRVSLLIIVS